MDVIEASHFEEIKKFIEERPWWEAKLIRENGNWHFYLINKNDLGPFSVMPFIHSALGEAIKLASIWIGEQHVIQEQEVTK